MMRRLPASVLVLCVSALLPVLFAAAQAAAPTASREISGVVVSAGTEAPLAGAHVTLSRSKDRKLAAETTTDAEGRFFFTGLGDGKFDLAADRQGYIAAAYQQHDGGVSTSIVTGEGLVSSGLRVELAPQAAIYGAVAEDSGDPVLMARISLYRRDPFRGTGKMVRVSVASADAMGNFEFPHLSPGSYYACAFGVPWYATRGRGWRAPQDQESARRLAALDVAYAATCYPDVTDPAGAEAIPVAAGARVEVSIAMHPAPAVHLQLLIPAFDNKHPPQLPQASVEVFGLSEPVNAPVYLAPRNAADPAGGSVTAEVEGLAAGQYDLELMRQGAEGGKRMSVEATASGASIDLTAAEPLPAVGGRVAMAGGAALPEGIFVSLSAREGSRQNGAAVDSDGKFTIPSLRAGDYDVTVNAQGRALAVLSLHARGAALKGHVLTIGSEPVELSAVVSAANAAVNGVVKRGAAPASGVFVVLVPDDPNAERARWLPNQSDSDGTFSYQGVAPGDYTVVAIEQGWTLEWARPEAMARYLAHGVKVSVDVRSREVDLADPLEAQPKEGIGPAAQNSAAAEPQ